METGFDLTVIGGGPGGYVAAIRAAHLGLRVALVEEREMGGTCLNRGCIPTKALLHSAEMLHLAGQADMFGVEAIVSGFDYSKMARRKDKVVKDLRTGVESLVRKSGGTIFLGRATLVDAHTIEVTGERTTRIRTDRILIATGSRPARPAIPGIDGEKVLDSDQVLALEECPGAIVILGGGVIGVEFATLFSLLGKKVTILEMTESLVPGLDLEISALLRKSLEGRGVRIQTCAKVASIASGGTAICRFEKEGNVQEVEGDIVIVAAGRRPNTEGLGLETVGVVLEKGFILVDDRLRTSVPGISAIGDVTGKWALAHAASAQGIVAAENAAGLDRTMEGAVVPACIYTSPEIATVGMSEAQARQAGRSVRIGRFPVSSNGRSSTMSEKEGMVKIVADESSGEILGVHIMAPRATDLIGAACVSMKLESTVEELAETVFPHPTVSEMLMEAASAALGASVHVPMKKGEQP